MALTLSQLKQALSLLRTANGVTKAAELIFANLGGGGGAVSSVFGRTGTVIAQPGDYTAAQVTGAVPDTRTLTVGPDTFDLSANRTFLGNVTNDAQTKASVISNTVPSDGQILVGAVVASGYVRRTVSGSGATITCSTTGVITISNIANASLANSSITIAGNATALGGAVTQDQITGLSSNGMVKRTGANALAIATQVTDYLNGSLKPAADLAIPADYGVVFPGYLDLSNASLTVSGVAAII